MAAIIYLLLNLAHMRKLPEFLLPVVDSVRHPDSGRQRQGDRAAVPASSKNTSPPAGDGTDPTPVL